MNIESLEFSIEHKYTHIGKRAQVHELNIAIWIQPLSKHDTEVTHYADQENSKSDGKED